jgi:Xaa-Pro aminopeptidase
MTQLSAIAVADSGSGPERRADRLAPSFAEPSLDAFVTFHMPNVRWLTGFLGSMAAAIVEPRDCTFVTDFRYQTQSEQQVGPEWKREIAPERISGAASYLSKQGARRIGFEARHLTVEDHRVLAKALPSQVELVPVLDMIEALRARKDPEELSAMRRAARVADTAIQQVVERGLAGRTEAEIALELEVAMRGLGATAVAYPPIVASGPHAALPHAAPRDVPIEEGMLVVIDAGAVVDGYCSDCTRTFAAGEPTSRAREVYELTLRAQQRALDVVRAGRTAIDVDAVARETITAGGHGSHFGHGLGHGVGIEMREIPMVNPRSGDVLQAGNVVTVEPGIYIPGELGVRIEDLVHVTPAGPDVLTRLPKVLQVVG